MGAKNCGGELYRAWYCRDSYFTPLLLEKSTIVSFSISLKMSQEKQTVGNYDAEKLAREQEAAAEAERQRQAAIRNIERIGQDALREHQNDLNKALDEGKS